MTPPVVSAVSRLLSEKPHPSEYPPYAEIYMRLVEDEVPLLDQMSRNRESTLRLLSSLNEETLLRSYAAGKWTIKDIILHVSDDERIYVYRALRFARADATVLPGFDQDKFARNTNANERSIDDLLDEFGAVREATILFFKTLSDAALLRAGTADGKRSTVRALAYHIAGHELHHMALVRRLYLGEKVESDR